MILLEHDWPARTTMYVDSIGESYEFTNHFSAVKFEIIQGLGKFVTQDGEINARAGQELIIPRKTRYHYEGPLAMLIKYTPSLHPDFVTFEDDQLDESIQAIVDELDSSKEMRKFDRVIRKRLQRQIKFQRFFPDIMGVMSFMVKVEKSNQELVTNQTK